ncbi:hypothetical protein RND71_008585 [Anisodus tanguticus]|uniref:K+ potassium transporter integral membrane domain-containing protein n=1 Tax=Anisodus tanguticus TaxID=243964 RepID=A0AAE1SP35_9SOLA|nr:hypothetical protein RND71_008585 [Anisodus tanguticus]
MGVGVVIAVGAFAKITFTSIVYPSLVLAYMGQATYLSRHHVMESDYQIGFYVSVPEKLRWPALVIAVLATVVGSQAITLEPFQLLNNAHLLDASQESILHTSSTIHGQIYIPEINWTLMLLCLAVTIGFRDTKRMGNAAGLAVITVMLVTTCLMSLVIVLVWHQSVFLAICFVIFFGSIEALYFSASLIKFLEEAWDDSQFEDDLVCIIDEFIRTGNTEFIGTPSTHASGVQLREDDEVKNDSVGT